MGYSPWGSKELGMTEVTYHARTTEAHLITAVGLSSPIFRLERGYHTVREGEELSAAQNKAKSTGVQGHGQPIRACSSETGRLAAQRC